MLAGRTGNENPDFCRSGKKDFGEPALGMKGGEMSS